MNELHEEYACPPHPWLVTISLRKHCEETLRGCGGSEIEVNVKRYRISKKFSGTTTYRVPLHSTLPITHPRPRKALPRRPSRLQPDCPSSQQLPHSSFWLHRKSGKWRATCAATSTRWDGCAPCQSSWMPRRRCSTKSTTGPHLPLTIPTSTPADESASTTSSSHVCPKDKRAPAWLPQWLCR
jgi:hypothetical protein